VIPRPKIEVLIVFTLFLVGSSFFGAPSYGAGIVVSGATCKAVNLNQARRGISNDFRGVKNNSTTESFFVVCPLVQDDTQTAYTSVDIQPLFPVGGGEMTCILRFQNLTTGAFFNVSVPMTSTVERPPFTSKFFAAQSPNSSPNATLTCPLDPGEGLEWVFLVAN